MTLVDKVAQPDKIGIQIFDIMPKSSMPTSTVIEQKMIHEYRHCPSEVQKVVETVLRISSQNRDKPNRSQLAILLEVIDSPNILAEALQQDPLAPAKARGVKVKAEIISNSANSQTFSQIIGISRQALDKRRKQGQVLALSLGRRGYAYPLWQANEGKILEGLDKVLLALADISDWGKAIFLSTGDIGLGGATPIEYLHQGKIEEAIGVAKLYGHQSAA